MSEFSEFVCLTEFETELWANDLTSDLNKVWVFNRLCNEWIDLNAFELLVELLMSPYFPRDFWSADRVLVSS